MSIAFKHSKAVNAAQRVILLGIANHAGDGGAWPTMATLAEYACVQPRQARAIVSELERMGEIRRDIQDGGTPEMAAADRPNLYHFLLVCPDNCDRTAAHRLLCRACNRPLSRTERKADIHPNCGLADPPVVHNPPGCTDPPPPVVQTLQTILRT